jgi:hypothetical protein
MKFIFQKTIILISIVVLSATTHCVAHHVNQNDERSKKWFVVLPLRFTQLQSKNTMLSGIKLGKHISSQLNASISIYHSFYLNSFKAQANLPGFNKQPRVFINCIAVELEYYLFKNEKVASSVQLLTGWGFIKYDSKEQNFKSIQVNYLALEPALNVDLKLTGNSFIGLGAGYRPIFSNQQIVYSYDNNSGELPVIKKFPNGLNIMVSLKGLL